MFFNFDDPQEAQRLIEQLRISFEQAASVPCSAQRQFESLSAQFNSLSGLAEKLIAAPQSADPMLIMTVLPAVMGLNTSFQNIKSAAEKDPEVKKVVTDLMSDIGDKAKILLKNFPQFPGLPDFSDNADTPKDREPPAPPKSDPPKRPEPPTSGEFKC